jgi:hypothetical protein
MLRGILQGSGPVGNYYKVLTGCFVTGSSFFGCFFLGVLFLDPRSWCCGLRVLGALGALDSLGQPSAITRPLTKDVKII